MPHYQARLKGKITVLLVISLYLLTACVPLDSGWVSDTPKESQPPATVPEVTVSGTVFWPGELFVIHIKSLEAQDEIKINTDLEQAQPRFYEYEGGKIALVGINCRTKPGKYKYGINVLRKDKVAARKDMVLDIMLKEFDKQYLKVSKKQQEQRSEDNLSDDGVFVSKAKSDSALEPLWNGVFVKPVEGRISTEYGMIRYVNGEETGRHTALDISAKKGVPVAAANSGIVKLAMMLKVTGYTVIIDHGCGIFSSYCHLDKMLVTEGQQVKKGDIVGEVGSTGFSTGPHLHWTVSAGPNNIDPQYLMQKDPLEYIKAN